MEKYTVTTSYLQSHARGKILIEFEHGKLGGVEDLITELSVTFHAKDLKVDITTYRSDSQQTILVHATSDRTSRRVRAEGKSQRIASAFWNALGEILLLASFSLGNFFFIQVTLIEFLVQGLEVYSLDDVDWVDDVPKGFAHLPSMRVPNHCMAVNLLERHLAG